MVREARFSLRAAVRKVRFLLSFDVTKWLARSASGQRSLRVGFNGPQGLLDVVSRADSTDSSFYYDAMSTTMSPGNAHSSATSSPFPNITRRLSSTSSGLLRTESGVTDPEEVDDINQRAQDFIDNFRRHLRREISLDLAYSRTSSLESNTGTSF